MNCLPTAKIISGKSKTKYSLSATQKYEQRIKDAKSKKEFQLCGIKAVKTDHKKNENSCNQCMDEWVSKRKEIDKWRKSVLSAMQFDVNGTGSNSNSDSYLQFDSSTLTTSSTLCSANTIAKKDSYINKEILTPTSEEKYYKVQKSPSIPLFQSNFKTPTDGNIINTDNLYYDFYLSQDYDSKISLVEDDDVFAPSDSPKASNCIGYSLSTQSSNQCICPSFTDPMADNYQGKHFQYRLNINTNATAHSNQAPMQYRPQNCTQFQQGYEQWKRKDQKHLYQEERCDPAIVQNNNYIPYERPSYRGNSYADQEKVYQSPKKALHKNETNAKLVLRPLDSSYKNSGNQPPSGTFLRTRSLNIKRSAYNTDQYCPLPTLMNNFENNSYNVRNNLSSATSTKEHVQRNNYDNLYERTNNRPNQSGSGSSKFIVLKPTFSQENIFYINRIQNPSMLKISSYNNLQFPTNTIPKVPIDEPLTMKFVFGSEPSLSRNF